MALQSQVLLSSGISLDTAYIIITNICVYYRLNDIPKIDIVAVIYKDQQSRSDSRTEVGQYLHTATGSEFDTYFSETVLKEVGKSIMSQAYEYLKSLPTYQNVIDV